MPPLISICIPTYNGEKYLAECMDSVCAQTFVDFEVLVVDDCSSDTTFKIASKYAAHDVRIRVLQNKKNLGLVGNWNRCVELAQGEWIKFVFQDDLIGPECIARMLSACEKDTALVACARELLFEPEITEEVRQCYRRSERTITETWGEEKKISAEQFCQATLEQLGANLIGEPTAVLLHRRVFQMYGNFNPALIMSCDLEYWARVAVHAGFVRVTVPLATFRVHGGATSAGNRGSRSYRMDVLDDLVVLHEFAFNSVYKPLLAAAAERQPPMNMEELFLAKAEWARNVAVSTANALETSDMSLLEEWTEVARSYPRISEVSQRHSFWGRLRERFRRHIPLGLLGRVK